MKFLTVEGDDTLRQRDAVGVGQTLLVQDNTITIPSPTFVVNMHRIAAPSGPLSVRGVTDILGAEAGQLVVLAVAPGSPGIPVIGDEFGNLQMSGNFVMDDPRSTITFACAGPTLFELARSPNL